MKNITIFCSIILLLLICGCSNDRPSAEQNESVDRKEEEYMQIKIQANENIIIFELNNSQGAKDLYEQLPLTIEVENYSTNEKVFYPPKKLSTTDTPMADARKGTLAYYAPWENVVIFYEDFGKGSELYMLGEVISGKEYIENMSGTIEITIVD